LYIFLSNILLGFSSLWTLSMQGDTWSFHLWFALYIPLVTLLIFIPTFPPFGNATTHVPIPLVRHSGQLPAWGSLDQCCSEHPC
jgi:hypothetical protein